MMNSPKTIVADDVKRDAAQRGTFLNSKLGHSPKRGIKFLGREQMSDFHHNNTTPLSKASGFFHSFVCFDLASGNFNLSEVSFQDE